MGYEFPMSAFAETWRGEFLGALTFLTRLPLRRAEGAAPAMPDLAGTSWAFPLVGVLVGIVGGIVYGIAADLDLPVFASALLAIAATVFVTGGLHEDGLADTADGFGGGATRDDKLAIMRDSRSGVYGVLALIFSVGLRAAALAPIAAGWRVLGALVAAHALSRGFLPLIMRALDPARADGLGAGAGRPEHRIALWAGGIAVLTALIATGLRPGLVASLAAAAASVAMAWLARRQIGGYTGDVLGAAEQAAEIAALLAVAAWSP